MNRDNWPPNHRCPKCHGEGAVFDIFKDDYKACSCVTRDPTEEEEHDIWEMCKAIRENTSKCTCRKAGRGHYCERLWSARRHQHGSLQELQRIQDNRLNPVMRYTEQQASENAREYANLSGRKRKIDV